MSKYKDVCFTSFIDFEPDYDKINYYVFGKEVCPNTGREHWQCFMQLKNRCGLSTVKKIIGDECAHIEQRKGTVQEASDYCKKDGDFVEDGEMTSQGKRTDIDAIKKLVNEGKLEEAIDASPNYQCMKMAELLYKYKKPKARDVDVEWWYGESGKGKTRKAFEQYPNAWISGKSGDFWNGYTGQDVIILDDFRRTWCEFRDLLRFLDRYPLYINVKGGYIPAEYTKVIITCPHAPEKLYRDHLGDEDLVQLLRRIHKLVKF